MGTKTETEQKENEEKTEKEETEQNTSVRLRPISTSANWPKSNWPKSSILLADRANWKGVQVSRFCNVVIVAMNAPKMHCGTSTLAKSSAAAVRRKRASGSSKTTLNIKFVYPLGPGPLKHVAKILRSIALEFQARKTSAPKFSQCGLANFARQALGALLTLDPVALVPELPCHDVHTHFPQIVREPLAN